jgi:hypothetical protein
MMGVGQSGANVGGVDPPLFCNTVMLVPLAKSGSCLFIFTTTYDDNNGS